MNTTQRTLSLLAIALTCLVGQAQASSIASSAADAGSSASDSASSTLNASSDSSTNNDKVAEGNYRITDIAQIPNKPTHTRISLRSEETQQTLTLDLPTTTWQQQKLHLGDNIQAKTQAYGLEFARPEQSAPFFLVLHDQWYSELHSRPVEAL